jgi:hypothetical protein
MKFLQRLNETTELNGYGVQEMGKKLSVNKSVQDKFIAIAGEVHQRATARAAIERGGNYDIDFGQSRPQTNPSGSVSPIGATSIKQIAYPVRQSGYSGQRQSAQRLQTYAPSSYRYPTRTAPVMRSGYLGGGQRAQFSDQR